MSHLMRGLLAVAGAAAVLAAPLASSEAAPKAAKSKGSCVTKSAEGTGSDAKAAQFQVDEALLQAVDWGAWASWMANGTTPGYDYGPRKYKCKAGGLGTVCVGTATICKKG